MGDNTEKKSKTILQLYNPNHKDEIIKLLQNAQRFRSAIDEDGTDFDAFEQELDSFSAETHDSSFSDEKCTTTSGISPGLSCCTCDISFSDVFEQRQHFKLDWHRHNAKRKEFFQKPITEAEFFEILDGLSSISGSDSEDEGPSDISDKLSSLTEKLSLIAPNPGLKNSPPESPEKSQLSVLQRLSRSPKTFFENNNNEVFALHQAILTRKESQPAGDCDTEEASSLDRIGQLISSPKKLGVVMLSGGHFAAGIFEGITELRHKTIHRYTVRAKQGGSQARADNKSGGSGPKSAGASLRRHNELALTQEIQTLINTWQEDFKQCQWIFYRISKSSQKTLFGGKSSVIFSKSNTRLRSIPFQTKRPTFSEVKRVMTEITSIEVYPTETFFNKFFPQPTSPKKSPNESERKSPEKNRRKNIDRARSRSPKPRELPPVLPSSPDEASEAELDVEFVLEEVPTELNTRNELQEFDDSLTSQQREHKSTPRKRKPRSKNSGKVKIEPWGITSEILGGIEKDEEKTALAVLQNHVKQKSECSSEEDLQAFSTDLNQRLNEDNSTILHVAVGKNFLDLIWFLLECGTDPALKDKFGKYPYNASPSKECRNLFRRFRGKFPEKYDYQKAQIPSPLTDEMVQEIAEKKKIQNKLKREKEKQKKVEKKEKEEELEEQKRFLDLSDREKRALAAERRLLGQCKQNGETKPVLLRCFDCALDITGKIPFEYNQNKFCSTKCLAAHRKKFPVPLSI